MRVVAATNLAGEDLGIGRLGDLRRVASPGSDAFCWRKTRPVELRSSSPERFQAAFGGFGGKGIRTPGLLIANETLYQLSYTPLREVGIMHRQLAGASLVQALV
jgi:hypothetical protein